jgi:hypothetical protein
MLTPVAVIEEGGQSCAALTKLCVRLQAPVSSKLICFQAICQNDFRVGQPWRRLYFPGQTFQGTSSYLCGRVWNSPFTVAGRKATNRPYL